MTPRLLSALSLFTAACALTGCEEGGKSGGLVDRYTPTYLGPKGTVLAGEFYPLVSGEIAFAAGSLSGVSHMTIRGNANGQPIDEDQDLPVEETTYLEIEVLPATSMAFATGTLTVSPEETRSLTLGDDPDFPEGEEETRINYFQKAAEALYLRGARIEGEPVYEPKAQVFLKTPLRIGDSWDAPLTDLAELDDLGPVQDLQYRSRMHVVGMETVTVGGKPVSALRLDVVTDISGTFTDVNGVAVSLTAELTGVMHLAAGVGQVRQAMTYKVNAKSSKSEGGTRVDVNLSQSVSGVMERTEGPHVSAAGRPAGAPKHAATTAALGARGPAAPALKAARAVLRGLAFSVR